MTSLLAKLNASKKEQKTDAPAPQPAAVAAPAAVPAPAAPAKEPIQSTNVPVQKHNAFAALAAAVGTASPSASLAAAKSGLGAALARVGKPTDLVVGTAIAHSRSDVDSTGQNIAASGTEGIRRDFRWTRQPTELEQEHVNDFVEQLNVLESCLSHKAMVSDALKSTLLYMKEYPFLADLLYPEDAGLMVKALRISRDVVIVKKDEKATKRSARQADIADAAELLGSGLSFGIQGFGT